MLNAIALAIFMLFVCPLVLFRDVVTPTDDVTTRVIVRQSASGQSVQIGSLTPGQQAEFIGSVPNVFRTNLNDGTCPTNPKKVGPDNDGQAGGCDNVRLTITGTTITPEYFRGGEL